MDKKPTDAEIVKALECCVSEQYTCEQCPYQEIKHYDYDNGFEIMPNGKQYDDWSCDRWLLTDLLDLINRLQADVENYKQIAEHQQSVSMERGFEIKRLKADIERLENILICFMGALGKVRNIDDIESISQIPIMTELNKGIRAEIKSEAYKEFAEKLREKVSWCFSYVSVNNEIDNLLKEKVGE